MNKNTQDGQEQDASDRRQLELMLRELKQQAEQLRQLARIPEENPNPILRISAEYVLLYGNPAAEQLCRYWSCWKGHKVPPVVQEIVSQALAAGQVQHHEITCGPATYWLTATPCPDEAYVNIYSRDITERKETEDRRAYLASFPQRNPNPILEVDLSGDILFMNPAAMRLFPDLAEQGISHPWLVDWATVVAPFREGQAETGQRDVTVGDRTFQQAIYYSAENRFVRIYGFDITERSRAEQTLHQAHEQLQAQAEELRVQTEELASINEELRAQQEELRQAESALRQMNEQLEERVIERTLDLQEANDALRRAGAYTRSLIEASLDPLVTIGPNGKITDVNAATEAVTGRTRKKLIGTDFSDYFTEPDKAREGYQQVFRDGFVRDYPLEIRHKTGRVTQVLYNATVYRDDAGNTVGVFAAARDVTDLRRAEQAVHAERRRFNDVLETLPAYLVLLTPDYHVPFANRFFRERFGDSGGKRCFEYLFGRTEPCEVCDTYKTLKTGKPQRWEWTGPDGHIYDIYDFPFTDTDGSPLIMEMGIDITERKKAEEALRKAHDELEDKVRERTAELFKEKALTDEIIDSLPGVFYLFNEQGRFLRWNKNFERVAGHTASEMARIHPLELFHGPDQQTIEERIRQVFVEGKSSAEAAIVSTDGSSTPHFFTGLRVTFDGAPCLVGMGIDISDSKQAQNELREAYERLQGQTEELQTQQEELAAQSEELHTANEELREQEHRLQASLHQTRRTAERLDLLSNTAGRLLASEQPQAVVEELCSRVMQFLNCQAFFNFLADPQAGRLRLNACAGIPKKERRKIEWLDYGVAVCGCVARDGRRIVAEHIPDSDDERTALVKSFGIQAYACHPILAGEKVLGTLSFGTRTRETFGEDDLSLMKTVTDLVAIAVQRQQAEQALRESEQRLKRAQEIARLGSWELDLASSRLTWSDEAYQLFGLTPQEFGATYKAFLERVHPEDQAVVDAAYSTSLRENRDSYEIEHRIIRQDTGEVRTVHEKCEHFRDTDGKLVRSVGMVHDITERKKMETQLRQLNEQLEHKVAERTERLMTTIDRLQDEVSRRVLAEGKLRKSSQMLEGFFQHTITPLAFLDPQFKFVRVNEAYAKADNKTPDHFPGKNHFDLYPHGENRAIFEQVVRTKQPYRAYARPFAYPDDPQKTTYWNWQLTPLLSEFGSVQALVLNLEDVTKQQRAYQELEYRTRQLQQLALELSQAEDRERKRLAEILHDDLQQMLAATKFHMGILAGRIKGDESLRDITEQINAMLKEAIDKSRSLSHELSPAVLYQGDLGETCEWLAQQVHAKHGLKVHVETSGHVDAKSDALKAFLYRTAQEMLFNVIKHAKSPEARLRLQRVRDEVWLTISDRGRGFDPRTLSRATGFGLLSIRERVGLLGGRMKIRSAVGRGSTFLIAVPDTDPKQLSDEQDAADAARTRNVAKGRSAKQKAAQRLRVLLVDDHEVMREGLATLLNEHDDIEVVGQAANGREAVNLAFELTPDVIIMDSSMPVMSGEEATRQIKRHAPEIRVIALSMFEEPQMSRKMQAAGAEVYLLKTAPSDELLAAIRGTRQAQ